MSDSTRRKYANGFGNKIPLMPTPVTLWVDEMGGKAHKLVHN
jgi:hypothetical protein